MYKLTPILVLGFVLLLLAGTAPFATAATNDAAFQRADKSLRAKFKRLDTHMKQERYGQLRWEDQIKGMVKNTAFAIKDIEKRWPSHNTKPMWGGLQKRMKEIEAKSKAAAKAKAKTVKKKTRSASPTVSADAKEAAAMEAFYRIPYKASNTIPRSMSASSIMKAVKQLEGFALLRITEQVEKDKRKYPAIFKYYGVENAKDYADLEYGGKKKPKVSDKNLKKVLEFYVPQIFEAKARLVGKEQTLADGIKLAIEKSKTVDDALHAVRLAKAVQANVAGNAMIEEQAKLALANLNSKSKAISHLIKGPYHLANMRNLVAFSAPPVLGNEDEKKVITALEPGKPFYLVGYLSESVKSIGVKKRDSKLGYEVTTYPDLKFRIAGQSQVWRLPLYSKARGKDLDKQGVVELPLLPDTSKVNFDTHMAYLPSLHFARWLMKQKPGSYQLEMSVSDGYGVDKKYKGAHGTVTLNISEAGQAALKSYIDKLWAKKLSSVVFPDEFGTKDRKDEIPNADKLSKYGKLLKLTAVQTNKVMKPWPLQHEIKNYVGLGYGMFEKDGRYMVIRLSFTRTPEQPILHWGGLTGLPDHYTLDGGEDFGPTVLNFGYEIPKDNLQQTGTW